MKIKDKRSHSSAGLKIRRFSGFHLDKCLLAYCMDGKNGMIAVKDANGKILAKSLLRLLLAGQGQRPVLFLDRLYPELCPSQRKTAILNGATACAQLLECDLFTLWEGYSSSPGTIIESLKGPCPYEYSDGSDGVIRDGIFEITELSKVYAVYTVD